MTTQSPVLALAIWAVTVAVFDIRERRVPNWLVGLGLAFGCISFVVTRDASAATPVQGLLGALLAFVVFLPVYVWGVMGAADVKVFVVLGLWLGAGMLVPVWLWATAAAGVHAVYAMARMKLQPVAVPGQTPGSGTRPARKIRGTPYAAFLALAALGVIVSRHPSWVPGF